MKTEGELKLERGGLKPVDAKRFRKVAKLGIVREKGWVYFPHSTKNQVHRAPHDPQEVAFSYKDEAELCCTFKGNIDRTTHVLVVDTDGDIAALERAPNAVYTSSNRGILMELVRPGIGGPKKKEKPVKLAAREVKTVLETLEAIAPDTYDEGEHGNWTFDGIEKSGQKWLVSFTNSLGSDELEFASKHHFVDKNGDTSQPWLEDLNKAVLKWSTDNVV